jgi:deoxyribodipyrimidine photo-lyase
VRVVSDDLDAWGLLPTTPDWAGGLRARWAPGEANAGRILERFVANILPDYHRRDEPGHKSTSNLSPHLRFGEISPFQVWHRAIATGEKNTAKFLSEVGWREFNWHILYHWPKLAEVNFRPEFDAFPWGQPGEAELSAWQHGHTGIPLVDAGMRELWQTGHMHNRVRMVVASFLVKNMLVDWRVGERWFWDTLVDADEASNPGNWQWVAGSGADAAPYFRIFNPLLQAEKFDPQREYIDTWLPPEELATAPILDLQETRRIALAAHEAMKNEPRS